MTIAKKRPNTKIHAAIVATEASENSLLRKMFLTPCFVEYPIVLIFIIIPTFLFVAYNNALLHCDNVFFHLVYDFLVMCHDKDRRSTVIGLLKKLHDLP